MRIFLVFTFLISQMSWAGCDPDVLTGLISDGTKVISPAELIRSFEEKSGASRLALDWDSISDGIKLANHKELEVKPGDKVLLLGAGTGASTFAFQAAGADVVVGTYDRSTFIRNDSEYRRAQLLISNEPAGTFQKAYPDDILDSKGDLPKDYDIIIVQGSLGIKGSIKYDDFLTELFKKLKPGSRFAIAFTPGPSPAIGNFFRDRFESLARANGIRGLVEVDTKVSTGALNSQHVSIYHYHGFSAVKAEETARDIADGNDNRKFAKNARLVTHLGLELDDSVLMIGETLGPAIYAAQHEGARVWSINTGIRRHNSNQLTYDLVAKYLRRDDSGVLKAHFGRDHTFDGVDQYLKGVIIAGSLFHDPNFLRSRKSRDFLHRLYSNMLYEGARIVVQFDYSEDKRALIINKEDFIRMSESIYGVHLKEVKSSIPTGVGKNGTAVVFEVTLDDDFDSFEPINDQDWEFFSN